MTTLKLRHKLKLDMHPLVGGKRVFKCVSIKAITVFMESVLPKAAFGKRTFVQLDFSRQRHSFAVGISRLGDF